MKFKIFLFAVLAFIYTSCGNKTNSPEENHSGHDCEDHAEIADTLDEEDIHNDSEETGENDAHNHEDVRIFLTSYSEDFEIFAEYDAFVIGKTSGILSHFTWLSDFKPLSVGKVTIKLIIDGKIYEQTISDQLRKGIYDFRLTPDKSGDGEIIFDITTNERVYNIVIHDVKVFEDEHDADEFAEEQEVSTENRISFTKEKSWLIDFATALPMENSFGQIIKTTAQIKPGQSDEVIVSALTGGIIIFSANKFLEGITVSKGENLLTIAGNNMADNNSFVRYEEARNNYEKAKADYDRNIELAKDKIVSEKDLLASKIEFENSKVIFENLNNHFNSTGQTVKSPSSGYIRKVFVSNGEFVEAGQPLMSVTGNKKLMIQADIQQKYSSVINNITSANIKSPNDNRTYTLEELNGRITSLGRSANEDNYMIPVTMEIDKTDGFMSGGFAEVWLKTEGSSKSVNIPNSALLESQGNFYVFVQITPELFEKREVHKGSTDGIRTEITRGLTSSERVVNKGALMIKLSQGSGTLDAHAGHVH